MNNSRLDEPRCLFTAKAFYQHLTKIKLIVLPAALCTCLQSVANAQTANWGFTLTNPTQAVTPGSTVVYDGSITNFTGGDLFLDTTTLDFDTDAPASSYTQDFADDFLDTLGIITISGYSGPIFSIEWFASATVGATGTGTVELTAAAPGTPSSLSQSFSNTIVSPQPTASLQYADTVLDFYDSGAGPIPGPYGGTPDNFPVPVPATYALGPDPSDTDQFLSLPTGSFVTVGFADQNIVDVPGNDIFIEEGGIGGEQANVFASLDLINFTLLGTASPTTTTGFDLASIGFSQGVKGIRIAGLDSLGGSPGFDLLSVQAYAVPISGPVSVPEPSTSIKPLLAFGLLTLLARTVSRHRKT